MKNYFQVKNNKYHFKTHIGPLYPKINKYLNKQVFPAKSNMLFDIHGPYTSIQKSVNSNANSNSNAWKKDIGVICGPIFVTFTPTLRKKRIFDKI